MTASRVGEQGGEFTLSGSPVLCRGFFARLEQLPGVKVKPSLAPGLMIEVESKVADDQPESAQPILGRIECVVS